MPGGEKRDRGRSRSHRRHRCSRSRSYSPLPKRRKSDKRDKEGKVEKELAKLKQRLELLEKEKRDKVTEKREDVIPQIEFSEDVPESNLDFEIEEDRNSIHTGISINIPENAKVSDELLAILGDDDSMTTGLGSPIHADLKSRWELLTKDGLIEDKRKQLIEKYPTPENFPTLSPPILNPEIKNATNNSVQRRDERLFSLQKQIAAALSAIGLAITSLLEEKGEGHRRYLELLSDAGRLIADLHCIETKARKELILLNIDNQLRDTLISAPSTRQLFGDNLEERINAAKNLKKISLGLKPPTRPNVSGQASSSSSSNRFQASSRGTLNFRSLPRQEMGLRQGRRLNNQQAMYFNRENNRRPYNKNYRAPAKNQFGNKGPRSQ